MPGGTPGLPQKPVPYQPGGPVEDLPIKIDDPGWRPPDPGLKGMPGGIDQTYGTGVARPPAQLGPTGNWQDVMNRYNAVKTGGA